MNEELAKQELDDLIDQTNSLVSLRAHWEATKAKELRREWALSDPDALKKELPARIGNH